MAGPAFRGATSFLATIFIIAAVLALGACATPPGPGQVAHARVGMVVGEWLYAKVKSGDQAEWANNPHRAQSIRDAIDAGMTLDDAREGRLVLCSCRYGSNSGLVFLAVLPRGVVLPQGDRVDIEVQLGDGGREGRPGTPAVFRRLLPHRPVGRTDCAPDGVTRAGQ